MSTVDPRFKAIENRLILIEQKLGLDSNSAATEPLKPTEIIEATSLDAASSNPFAQSTRQKVPPVVIMDNSSAPVSPATIKSLAKKLKSSPPALAPWQLTGNSDLKSSGAPTTIMAVGSIKASFEKRKFFMPTKRSMDNYERSIRSFSKA